MKRNLIFIIFFLFNVCFGQNSETEKLVNAVVNDIIPKDYQYFNLIDSSFIDHRTYLAEEDVDYLKKEYSDLDFDNIIDKNKTNKEILNWKNFKIEKARLYDFANIPEYHSYNQYSYLVPYNTPQNKFDSLVNNRKKNQLIIRYKKTWSKKRIEKETNKAWEIYNANIVKENKTYYQFSTPYFSDNGYAIIYMNIAGSGYGYIYKKENNEWKQILDFKSWVQ